MRDGLYSGKFGIYPSTQTPLSEKDTNSTLLVLSSQLIPFSVAKTKNDKPLIVMINTSDKQINLFINYPSFC